MWCGSIVINMVTHSGGKALLKSTVSLSTCLLRKRKTNSTDVLDPMVRDSVNFSWALMSSSPCAGLVSGRAAFWCLFTSTQGYTDPSPFTYLYRLPKCIEFPLWWYNLWYWYWEIWQDSFSSAVWRSTKKSSPLDHWNNTLPFCLHFLQLFLSLERHGVE